MPSEMQQITVDDFRQHLDKYLLSRTPLTIVGEGRTVGYFMPVHKPDPAALEAFKRAAKELQDLMAAHGITEDEVVKEFDALRKQKR